VSLSAAARSKRAQPLGSFISVVRQWLDGSIDQDGEACYLRGSPDLIAYLVIWFRELEPAQELVLVLDADGELHRVPANVTRGEVLAML
jgi:hypothetical protein